MNKEFQKEYANNKAIFSDANEKALFDIEDDACYLSAVKLLPALVEVSFSLTEANLNRTDRRQDLSIVHARPMSSSQQGSVVGSLNSAESSDPDFYRSASVIESNSRGEGSVVASLIDDADLVEQASVVASLVDTGSPSTPLMRNRVASSFTLSSPVKESVVASLVDTSSSSTPPKRNKVPSSFTVSSPGQESVVGSLIDESIQGSVVESLVADSPLASERSPIIKQSLNVISPGKKPPSGPVTTTMYKNPGNESLFSSVSMKLIW